ncbi:aldehyde dehydrogenase family protein [Polaromonas eurypsychrophila]|uniref:4-(hydroxymethyl)benzenesulfonate dehydrogenase n=1 Tax=Polaromonas eurypsychrophila TaxID=1614635 RepID=A0A916SQW9_9BURK|nr:aldehyde dehydrogenase family protein [Polaromonas eurypsychrophila]GGB13662.1 betaine-aldehyde dehydrogenase [Polaromonas eurypsychrophila]
MTTYASHYINGQWVTARSKETLPVHDSSTEEVMATVPAGTAQEAELAVLAARAAFDAWSTLPVETRAAYLEKVAAGLKARTDEMAMAIAREVGMPLKMAKTVQVGGPTWHWGNFAKVARNFEWEKKVGNSLVVREAIGVVGCITPWNFPLSQITLKIAPALAAGCTVVLKPSEIAPVNAMILAEIIHEAGLPPGVFNLVNGMGPVVGEVLATHPEVDMVSFTGSTGAGKRVSELASQSVKRIALELGGKSASVILEDADFEAAVKGTISACMLNSGQTCSAHTRMLVPAGRYDEVKALAQTAIAKFSVGPSLDETSRLGPLVSANQRARVLGFIRTGIEEGADVIAGGAEPPAIAKGYFVQPTILGIKSTDTLAQEEIFGPVLVVIPYKDEEEAVAIANSTIYGLGGGVWSGSDEHAMKVARRIRTGQVDINGGPFNGNAPFGGYKQSGNGRENGVYGFEEFLEFKSLQLKPVTAA